MVTVDQSQKEFQQRVEPYRRELHLHCYRMMGSVQESEDLVQETFVRAWRGFGRFEGRASLRAWLYRIATNTCLSALERRPRRVLPETEGLPNRTIELPTNEIVWLEPYPDSLLEEIADASPGPDARYERQEAIELAFIAAVQFLPPRQRGVLLLCDVMGWSASETAELLDSTVVSVNSALQRARATLSRRREVGRPWNEMIGADRQQGLIQRYIRAWERMDMDAFIALLREDALLSMPPLPQWYEGRDAIRAFFDQALDLGGYASFRLLPTSANLQPGCAVYSHFSGEMEHKAHSLHIFTVKDEAITVLTAFIGAELFPVFGLPLVLPSDGSTVGSGG